MNRRFAGFILFLAVVRPSGASRFGIFEGVPRTQERSFVSKKAISKPSWAAVPRGGDSGPDVSAPVVTDDAASSGPLLMVVSALKGLATYMKGPKADTMLLLLTTALNTPLSKMVGTSPILGYLFLGLLFGPNGMSLVKDIHTTEMLADIGIV